MVLNLDVTPSNNTSWQLKPTVLREGRVASSMTGEVYTAMFDSQWSSQCSRHNSFMAASNKVNVHGNLEIFRGKQLNISLVGGD